MIHFDSDTFIVSKLETIWNKFNEFNDKEIIGGSDDCGIDMSKLNRLPIMNDNFVY